MANIRTNNRIRKYSFRNFRKNPDFRAIPLVELQQKNKQGDPSVEVPLRSCLYNNKGQKPENKEVMMVKQTPKYLTNIDLQEIDTDTGEYSWSIVESDDLKSARGRMIAKVIKFCNYYQPLYKKKEVSVIFHTFTVADRVDKNMKEMIKIAKYRYKTIGRDIRGYLWVSEVAPSGHWHYHLVIAIDRLSIRGGKMPEALKFNNAWGKRTKVEFIKKSVNAYLTKYITKETDGNGYRWRIIGKRGYAISRKLI